MMSVLVVLLTVLVVTTTTTTTVDAFSYHGVHRRTTTTLLNLYQDFDEEGGQNSQHVEPYFRMQQIPTATASDRLDHVVECAEKGECDVEEMMNMIDELEELNAECESTLSRECNLDAVAARNVLKVALASKIMLEEAQQQKQQQQQQMDDDDDGCYYNPFAALGEMDDECIGNTGLHGIPTDSDATMGSHLDRIVQCAQGDEECPVGEIADMIDELERLNLDCEGTISRECSLDAMEARNILKVALGAQAAMARAYESRAATTIRAPNGSSGRATP